jgi:cysteine desulfuration protein SufE
LIIAGKNLPGLEEEEKTSDNKVEGCASRVWLVATLDEAGHMHFRADSDSNLVKGLIAILHSELDSQTPSVVLNYEPTTLQDLGLDKKLSLNRVQGFQAILKKLKTYALVWSQTPLTN